MLAMVIVVVADGGGWWWRWWWGKAPAVEAAAMEAKGQKYRRATISSASTMYKRSVLEVM